MNFTALNLDAIGWPQLLEMLIIAAVYYYVLLFLRGTRGAQVLMGMVLSLGLLFLLTTIFRLNNLNWMVQQMSVFLPLAFVIIFQPEIRRALAELGRPHFSNAANRKEVVDEIVEAVDHLSDQKIGALIALEREIGLGATSKNGTPMDSAISKELLSTLFFPRTPLHDGGVVIKEDRIVAAGCLFPLSQREELNSQLGTRHRAAIGLTEESDAIVVVVSEETGTVSLAYKGKLSRGLSVEKLKRMLASLIRRSRGTFNTETQHGMVLAQDLEEEGAA